MNSINVYHLNDVNSEAFPPQTLVFYEMGTEESPAIHGTTVEEVIKVATARLRVLNDRFACRENALAITKLEEALHWLDARTLDRVTRGVEGQHTA